MSYYPMVFQYIKVHLGIPKTVEQMSYYPVSYYPGGIVVPFPEFNPELSPCTRTTRSACTCARKGATTWACSASPTSTPTTGLTAGSRPPSAALAGTTREVFDSPFRV